MIHSFSQTKKKQQVFLDGKYLFKQVTLSYYDQDREEYLFSPVQLLVYVPQFLACLILAWACGRKGTSDPGTDGPGVREKQGKGVEGGREVRKMKGRGTGEEEEERGGVGREGEECERREGECD